MSYNIPDTSKAAYEVAKKGLIHKHAAKILDALRTLKKATAEEIAIHIGLTHTQVNRRMAKMAENELIKRTDNKEKRPTTTGREAYVWEIMEPKTETKNLYINQKSAAEHASDLIQSTRQGTLFQTTKK